MKTGTYKPRGKSERVLVAELLRQDPDMAEGLKDAAEDIADIGALARSVITITQLADCNIAGRTAEERRARKMITEIANDAAGMTFRIAGAKKLLLRAAAKYRAAA